MLSAAFPNAMQIGRGWGMLPVWIIMLMFGLLVMWSTIEQNAHYMFPWQIRGFLGTIAIYASLNAFANKLIANGVF